MEQFRLGIQNPSLYGRDATERIVAVEFIGRNRVVIYRRGADGRRLDQDEDDFQPWLVTTEQGARELAGQATFEPLAGDLPLGTLASFSDWSSFLRGRERLESKGILAHVYGNPVDQYLTRSGRTLFKGMDFVDIVRLQLDIETIGLQAHADDSRILAVALRTNRGYQEVVHHPNDDERQIVRLVNERVRELDPDVIEGHNLFNFDLPFLLARARAIGTRLDWGRDGSELTLRAVQRFKVGSRTIPFQNVAVQGRHVIDTYQQIQRYDSAGELESYGLKEVVASLGLTRPGRVFLDAADIARLWQKDREQVVAYALDDVSDVEVLSSLTTPTEFYQTQILPRSFQNVAVGGTGEKINLLMSRAYLQEGHSLPQPEAPRPYPGGYSEVKGIGVFRPVVKCDVESLYPALMLTEQIAPSTDRLGVYLDMLHTLTAGRLMAKRLARTTSGQEQVRWQGLQLSFKVLINSFYGYLGYSRALFNDYDAAERVTLRGQEIIRSVAEELTRLGAETIEIDTDGIYFRPPTWIRGSQSEEEFVGELGRLMPTGISLAHDGSYAGMLSLKTKNYALLDHDDRLILKGSSLRSRRDERVFRRFLREAARRFIKDARDDVRSLYFETAERIVERHIPIQDIVRWETVTEKTFTSEANRRLALAAGRERVGERVPVYQRSDGELVRIEQYAGDEDIDYLLRRLRDMAQRFQPLFSDDSDFDYVFPRLTSRTDLQRLRDSPPMRQATLFD